MQIALLIRFSSCSIDLLPFWKSGRWSGGWWQAERRRRSGRKRVRSRAASPCFPTPTHCLCTWLAASYFQPVVMHTKMLPPSSFFISRRVSVGVKVKRWPPKGGGEHQSSWEVEKLGVPDWNLGADEVLSGCDSQREAATAQLTAWRGRQDLLIAWPVLVTPFSTGLQYDPVDAYSRTHAHAE